jgi:hypothetical protein
MKLVGAISLGVGACAAVGLIVVQMVSAQPQRFATEARTFTDVTRGLNGTWTLKQRSNPDGTPYRSKLQGVTYISVTRRNGDTLGPHATATLYSKESGIADTHFYNYPPEIANKPFTMESSGTWLIHNVQNTAQGAEISARVFAMTKGDLQAYKNGMVLTADIRYRVSRAPARPGAAAVIPRLEVATVNPGELTDFSGARIDPTSMTRACCGMSNFTVFQDVMDITWSNKGKDVWVKSSPTVPVAFR